MAAKKPKPLVLLTYPIHHGMIENELKPFARTKIIRDPKRLASELKNADGLITRFNDPVPDTLLARAPKLKVIGNFAVGVDNIDLQACARRKIRVVNTPRVLTRATAELTLALLLSVARRIPEGERMCRENAFPGWQPDMLLGQLLEGRRAVLVGRGRIGSETGRLFRAIGLRIDWVTRKDSEREIQRKLGQAQILSLHVPLSKETHHWLNARRLAYLPKDAIVLNTTRGPVVDEKALIRALKQRKIFGAGLDVFEKEPEIPAALRKLPNVTLLPHLGSATEETRQAMARLAVQGVLAVLDGKRPWNTVV